MKSSNNDIYVYLNLLCVLRNGSQIPHKSIQLKFFVSYPKFNIIHDSCGPYFWVVPKAIFCDFRRMLIFTDNFEMIIIAFKRCDIFLVIFFIQYCAK